MKASPNAARKHALSRTPRIGDFPHQAGHRDVGADGRGVELTAIRGIGRILVLEEAVQEAGMRGIDADPQGLQPLAGPQTLEGEHMLVRSHEAIERRHWRRLPWAEVSPDDPAAFDAGIRGLSYFQVDGAARRFGGLLQTRT